MPILSKTHVRNRFAGAVLLLLLFINALWWTAAHYRPTLNKELQSGEIQPESGHAYTVHFTNPNFIYAFKGDNSAEPQKSSLQVFENGQALGPAHAVHETVRISGGGAFSHWGKSLYFSSSDNTDPRTNGRTYSVTVRSEIRLTVAGLFLIVNSFLILTLGFLFYTAEMISKAAVLGFCTAALSMLFLFLNLVPVTHFVGRIFYGAMAFILVIVILFLVFQESQFSWQKSSLAASLFRKLQLGLSILFLVLISLEALCRVFPIADTLAVNPGCRFFWPDWYRAPLNEQGYREREIPEKEPGVYRILIYGDSYIEGAGVSRGNLAGVHLEGLLNQKLKAEGSSLRVEAYNLGHCGANTRQEASWIRRDYEALKPDLIILAYVLNDAEGDAPALIESGSRLSRVIASYLTGDNGSYLYYRWLRVSARLFPSTQPSAFPGKSYIEGIHQDSYPGWHAARQALADLQEWSQQKPVDFFAVILPLFTHPATPDMDRVMSKVSSEMTRLGIENYNLLGYFKDQSKGDLSKLAFSSTDSHPNRFGHAELAKFLTHTLWPRAAFREAALQK